MPRLNGTGPQGRGPQTGMGLGQCGGGFRQKSRLYQGQGQALGRGRLNRRGCAYPQMDPQSLDEAERLFKDKLEIIQKQKAEQ